MSYYAMTSYLNKTCLFDWDPAGSLLGPVKAVGSNPSFGVRHFLAVVGLDMALQQSATGKNVMPDFFDALEEAKEALVPLMQKERQLEPLCKEDESAFMAAHVCHICETAFNPFEFETQKARDHDHYSGKFIGAAHMSCNRLRRAKNKLCVYIHNLAGYDSHFILHEYNKECGSGSLSAIPINSQKFRTLEVNDSIF